MNQRILLVEIIDMDNLIEDIVQMGIPVTLTYSKEYGIVYDLNTGMKSHFHLVKEGDKWKGLMRYGKETYIDGLMDLLWEVKSCMCGRDYMASEWERVFIEKDMIKKICKQPAIYGYE